MKTIAINPLLTASGKKNNPGLLEKFYQWSAAKLQLQQGNLSSQPAHKVQLYSPFPGTAGSHEPLPVNIKPSFSDKLKYPFLKLPFAFAHCQWLPESNFEIMLEAFSKLPQYTLVAACSWSSSSFGSGLYKKYAGFSNIILLESSVELPEMNMLQSNSFVYIHACGKGNEKAPLARAMQLGLPVIAYYTSHNRIFTGNRAFYYSTAEELKEIILKKSVIDLKHQGMQMKEIAGGF